MKIIFIGGRDIHILGGIENYMYNLATQLVRKGHEPIVFCEADRNGEDKVNGFRVIYQKGPKSPFLCKPLLGIKSTWRTIRSIRKVDFIHYNAWPPALSAAFARLLGKRCIMMGHGMEWKRSKYSPFQQKLNKIMERVSTWCNNNLIMCSDEQSRYYMSEYNRKAFTVPTAITPPDLDRELQTSIHARFKIRAGKYFLFLGRIVQDKNTDYLVRAFREAHLDDFQLVIAGGNPANPDYVRKVHKLAKGNRNIIFTDVVYGDDKEWLLRNAFAFCIPSTVEGLSIALLEGMSYGLPIVASRIEANREVLSEENAFWCDAEDVNSLVIALRAVASSPIGKEMGERNRAHVLEKYTWDKVADRYIATISRWLPKKHPDRL